MAEPRVTFLRGHESINVAGESHYQEALRAIAGDGDVRHDTEAHLIPEPENEYDPNAVRVEIDGRKVGYLPRDLAPAWGPRLAELATRRRVGGCEATVVGPAQGTLGVFLRLPDPHDEPDGLARRL
ncbi:MAG TPA: HIRAN domain-containing protein [Thermoleophilaceae bacterium]|nr:HIRAN domain-containing protein [Thermoleophilaceae bacterium]